LKANFTKRIDVPFADVDMMGHVNNAKYFTYLENARTEYIFSQEFLSDPRKIGIIIARAELDFKSPSKWRDELTVKMRTSAVGNSSWVYDYEIINEKEKRLIAAGKTVQVSYDYRSGKSISIPKELRKKLIQQIDESIEDSGAT
jgi:acyl-CoA thioester hydrolase